MFTLNWLVNEHVFGEEDLRNQKITFPEVLFTRVTTGPGQDGRAGKERVLLFCVSPPPSLNERL